MGSDAVTAADREKAMRAAGYHPRWTYDELAARAEWNERPTVDRIAQALANERVKAQEQIVTRVLAIHRNGADYNDCAICSFGHATECPTVLALTEDPT